MARRGGAWRRDTEPVTRSRDSVTAIVTQSGQTTRGAAFDAKRQPSSENRVNVCHCLAHPTMAKIDAE